MLNRDIFHIILNYLKFKDTLTLHVVCKQFHLWLEKWRCQEVLKINNPEICPRYPFLKFSIRLYKLQKDIPDNLHTLDLSYTPISSIDGFDVKNLHTLNLSYTPISSIDGWDVKNLDTLYLYGTQISEPQKNELRKKVKIVN